MHNCSSNINALQVFELCIISGNWNLKRFIVCNKKQYWSSISFRLSVKLLKPFFFNIKKRKQENAVIDMYKMYCISFTSV